MEIWRNSVEATHQFLKVEDRLTIEKSLSVFLPQAPLWLALDGANKAMGFILLDQNHIEALFVDPCFMGQGIGRQLIRQAVSLCDDTVSVDVNKQNEAAISFYNHLGFITTGQSESDRQGRPYPLIFMELPNNVLK